MDSIEDMPSNEAWPNGAHVASVKASIDKKDPKKPKVIFNFTLISTEEQADPDEKPANAGDKNAMFFHLKKKDGEVNEFAKQQLKTLFGNPLVEAGLVDASAPLSAVIEHYKDGVDMLLSTKKRKNTTTDEWQMDVKTATLV
jgi:hypothetical protein